MISFRSDEFGPASTTGGAGAGSAGGGRAGGGTSTSRSTSISDVVFFPLKRCLVTGGRSRHRDCGNCNDDSPERSKRSGVFVSCRKFDDSALVERREMRSKLAKIGSIDSLVSRANPKHNR